jgi:ADP-heptose:LPS heptosyltransferase
VAALFYTHRVAADGLAHVIDKNLRLAGTIGAPTHTREFPLMPVRSSALESLRAGGLARYALINCGAAWPNKRWPADRFGRIAAWLREQHGLASVVMWGPGEQALADAVVASSDGAAVAAPPTGLSDLVAIAHDARIMVSGDTGPTHVAAALGTPVVSIFGPTDPHRNGPWGNADIAVSRYERCTCHYERVCRHGEGARWCLGEIREEEVRQAIDRRLADSQEITQES